MGVVGVGVDTSGAGVAGVGVTVVVGVVLGAGVGAGGVGVTGVSEGLGVGITGEAATGGVGAGAVPGQGLPVLPPHTLLEDAIATIISPGSCSAAAGASATVRLTTTVNIPAKIVFI